MKRRSLVSVIMLVASNAYAQDVQYEYHEMPGLGGTTLAVDINENNLIAGHSWTPGPFYGGWPHAFTYDPISGETVDLGPVAEGFDSFAGGINDFGHVSGYGRLGTFDPNRGFLQIDDSKTLLPTLGGNNSYANVVNNNGLVVGAAEDSSGRRRAVVWQNAVPTDLGDLGGSWAEATDINQQNQIIGWAELAPSGTRHAFFYDNGVMTDISGNFAGWVLPFGVNENGDCAGYIYNFGLAPWAYVDGQPIALQEPGFGGVAWNINNDGNIVGYFAPSSGVDPHAAIWPSASDAPIDLNDLIEPNPDVVMNSATSINENGWICGWGTRVSDGETVGFVLIPVSEGITLTVDATCPGGGPIQVAWDGATPNGPVALVGAASFGSFVIPNNLPCAGTMLRLGNNRLRVLYQGSSNQNGGRVINTNASGSICGGKLQLIDLTTCEVSNVAVIE